MLLADPTVTVPKTISPASVELTQAGGETHLRVGKLQWILHAALDNARRIDARAFECDTHERILAEHLPGVRAVVEETIVVLNAVIGHYDREADVSAPDSSGMFHVMFEDIVEAAKGDDTRQRVADVAFMARWELIRKLDALEAAEPLEYWDLIAACGSAQRRLVKAISGVERVLADVEGRPSVFACLYQTQSEEAVLIRSAYARLIARLREVEQQVARLGINRSLRLVGIAIASLVGQEIYEALRIEDRRTLRALQRRVIDWLRGDRSELEGQRLLSDACALGSLLMEVNRRPELVEHDRKCLEQLLREIERPQGDKLDVYEQLINIRGRDAELDDLLDAFVELDSWQAPAQRVLGQLGPW